MYTYNGGEAGAIYDYQGNVVETGGGVSCGWLTRPEYKTVDGNPYRLVWHDEFDGKELDRNFWNENYYISNVQNRYQAQTDYRFEDSILKLRCRKDAPPRYLDRPTNVTATSSIMTAEFNDTYASAQRYHDIDPFWGLLTQEGYYEMRLKLWQAQSGTCNVWWLMGIQDAIHTKARMDGRGEVDILEFLQKTPTKFPHGQHPNADTSITEMYRNTETGIDLTAAFHTVGFLWENGAYKWYLDGTLIDTMSGITIISYPVYHVISAYKVISGGEADWKGPADPELALRDVEFEIDYLRIYKKATTQATTDVTISGYTPITINAATADMEIDPDRGCPYQFPSFVYVNWSDGTRTEHWVKWDSVRDTYTNKMTNEQDFDWSGYVYELGINVVANVNY